ncbi:MAG TPA: hypothetical protein VM262_16765 [Acidimicrobiales bacterium]|nr:hypothetical protein [Acidimicrobiales bacterium]
MAAMVETGKARLTWSADGSTVTKVPTRPWTDPVLGDGRRVFRNEQRVHRLLAVAPPPVRVPAFIGARRGRWLEVEAIAGEPLGPKYPLALAPADLVALVDLAGRLGSYRPRRRWFRRFPLEQRIAAHHGRGLLSEADVAAIRRLVERQPPRLRFAHGDITARNVLRAPSGELVLIDWEWAGLYPDGYELAFLWFALADLPEGRAAVAGAVEKHQRVWFTLSALFVQLLHLHMWRERDEDVRPVHHETLAALLAATRDLAASPTISSGRSTVSI